MPTGKNTIIALIFCWVWLFSNENAWAQPCGSGTPVDTVNLTGKPNGLWTSPTIVRNDTCCGATSPAACVEFVVTLDTAAVGLIFTVCSGAVPPGALYYQIGCGPQIAVGSGICLTPPGPFIVTFCKPGNNSNQYCIQSVSPPHIVGVDNNCSAMMWTYGYAQSTITWNSVYPGPTGAYNPYLSCTSGCDTTYVTPQPGYPPYILYRVCGTSISGCSKSFCDTVRVNINSQMTGTVTQAKPACFGGTAAITANISGGTTPYKYQWNTGATTQSINAGAGTYTVTVNDATVCPPLILTVTVTEDSAIVIAPTVKNALCSGQCNGSASVSVSGGKPGYSYSWSPGGATTTSITGLCAATYTATITDANGCTQNAIIPVSQPPAITAALSQVNVSCTGGSDGTATITPSGGTTPYSYSWSNGQTTSTATGLSATSYTCTITDKDNCTATNVVTISQPPPLTSSLLQTNVSCYNGSDGTATVTPSGGTTAYSYSWSNGQTTSTATGLSAGGYTCTITDKNNCTVTNAVTISQPPLLTSSSSQVNVSCYIGSDGTATVIPSGGTTPYTYSWSNGQTTSTATGLSMGSYTCTITDKNNCTSTNIVTISQPVLLTSTSSQVNVSCYNGSNGTATVNPSGGTTAYSYSWSNGQTTSTATGLSAGSYTCTITDRNNCTVTNIVTITQPPALNSTSSQTNVSCYNSSNGTATVNPSGGTTPYSYSWSNGQTTPIDTGLSAGSYTCIVTDKNNCTTTSTVTISQPAPLTSFSSQVNILCNGDSSGSASVNPSGGTPAYSYSWSNGQTTSTATGLIAGSYTCTITDKNKCTTANIVTISQPPPLTSSISQVNVSCNGGNNGSATVIASGGTPGYSFSWSSGQTTSSINLLSAGNYICTITDSKGCTASDTARIKQPTPIVIKISGGVTNCINSIDTLVASVSGGIPGYSYAWNPSGGTTSSIIVSPAANTTYTATIKDANGCKDTAAITVTVYPEPVAAFSVPNNCQGGTTYFTDHSSGAVKWAWNFGEPSSGPNNTSPIQNPFHIYGSSGTFHITLVVTNNFGCTDSITRTIIINPVPTINFTPTTACFRTLTQFSNTSTIPTGSIVNWSWNFGDPSSGPNNISILQNPAHQFTAPGNFNVTLTAISDSGCQSSLTIPVTVYPLPTAKFIITNACSNTPVYFTDASSMATQWLWDFGNFGPTSTLQNPNYTYPSAGRYVVTLVVTSAAGCKDTTSDTVTVYPSPVPNFTPDSVCAGFPTSFKDLSVSPSGTITNWLWDFGDGSGFDTIQNPTHTYPIAGTYSVTLTVTSTNGCKGSKTKLVVVFPKPVAQFSYSPNPYLELGTTVNFTNQSDSNAAKWYWYFGDGSPVSFIANPTHLYADTGSYLVTLIVESPYGCFDTVAHPLSIDEIAFYIPNAFSPNNDVHNSTFYGKGVGITDYEMWIFDRWGMQLFYCHVHGLPQSLPCQWDGRVNGGDAIAQEDVYVWKVHLVDRLGNSHAYIGTVTIVK